MMKLSVSLRKFDGRDEILNSYSVQLAHYVSDASIGFSLFAHYLSKPGQASGYTRHLDSFAPKDKDGERRQLTMIYYLNREAGLRGGQLRAYVPETLKQTAPAGAQGPSYVDVDPVMGTLVVFQRYAPTVIVMPDR
jgi:hypothetical protein